MKTFDFERSKNEAGGIRYTAYKDGEIICQISNLHSFNIYPTNGKKYGVEVRYCTELSGRNFRRLKDAKHFLDANYELINQQFDQAKS